MRLILILFAIAICAQSLDDDLDDSGIGGSKNGDLESMLGIGVQFYAYTNPSNPGEKREIRIGDKDSLRAAGLKRGQPIKIYAHGFLGRYDILGGSLDIKNAYLSAGFRNVVLIKWETAPPGGDLVPPLGIPMYFFALWKYLPQACETATNFLFFLHQSGGYSPDSMHLIGSSLGAHLAGCVGKRMKRLHGLVVNRVTGLDPGGLFNQLAHRSVLLEKGAAAFVDVLHTDIDFIGTPRAVGHVDFYANGGLGYKQNGCPGFDDASSVTKLFTAICAHPRAIEIWIYLIQSKETINAYPCATAPRANETIACGRPRRLEASERVQCRENSDRSPRGKYFLPISKAVYKKLNRIGSATS